jgi:hypothetical protein
MWLIVASYRHLTPFLREHHREVRKGKVVPVFHILWGVETLVDYALLKKKKILISYVYKKLQKGSGAESYMTRCFLKYEENVQIFNHTRGGH